MDASILRLQIDRAVRSELTFLEADKYLPSPSVRLVALDTTKNKRVTMTYLAGTSQGSDWLFETRLPIKKSFI